MIEKPTACLIVGSSSSKHSTTVIWCSLLNSGCTLWMTPKAFTPTKTCKEREKRGSNGSLKPQGKNATTTITHHYHNCHY